MNPRHADIAVLEPIRWRSWPLRERPRWLIPVVLGLAAIGVLVHGYTGSAALTCLALSAAIVALWRFFLPVIFEVNEAGVEQWLFGRGQRLPWQAIQQFRVCRSGVLLVPRGQRTELAPLGSLYMPLSSDRDRVLLFVEHFLPPPRQPTDQ